MMSSIFRLSDLLEAYDEQETLEILSSFKCSRDRDLEGFLKKKAIFHDRKDISKTYLHIDLKERKIQGYFTLAMKCMTIDEDMSIDDDILKLMNADRGIAQAYLIGQLSKTDGGEKELGKKMIKQALQIFQRGKESFGCHVVRLDCKNELVSYYENEGFICIGKNKRGDLNQMVIII